MARGSLMKRRLLLSVTLPVTAGLPSPAAAQRSVQEALARATPAVVLVVAEVASEVALDCGTGPKKVTPPVYRETGTGWFIDADGWLMTNGHVVQPAYRPPTWLVNQQAQRAVTTTCLPSVLERSGVQPGEWSEAEEAAKRRLLDRVLPTASVTLHPHVFVITAKGQLEAEVKKYSAPASREGGEMSGRDLALLKVSGDNFPVLFLADSRSAQVGDPVHIIGFPGVVLSHELLNQSAMVAASVTNGAISGFKQDRNNNPLIQTDAPATWGNSGAPMVNDRGQVVGVLTFVSLAPGPEGGIVQGFNFVLPSRAVTDFVRGTPVRLNAGGRFNDAWNAGLHAFFVGDWKGALRHLEEADRLHPNQPDVRRMLADARESVRHPPPRPFPWFWVTVGITLLSAGGYGTQLLRRWQRNRYRVQPSEVVKMIEEGKAPILMDTRAADSYEALPLRIPGSVRLTPDGLAAGAAVPGLDINRPVVAYCTSPDEATSAGMTQELRRRGFKDVKILKGGLGGWIIAGLPVDTPSDLSPVGKELYKALATGNV
jgi:S1-C subfamily serine protease/rhodanese-related sulfurtransferase